MNVVIVQYGSGNTISIQNALHRLGVASIVTSNPTVIRSADRVILPGVGAAGAAMYHLRQSGLDETLTQLQQPVLGICLGMQLLSRYSDENQTPCLSIIDTITQKFIGGKKVPHMGWNEIHNLRGPLFENVADGEYVYYVHSYFVPPCPWTTATTDYIHQCSAAIQKQNFFGVQFHPEKSGSTGAQILANFLKI